MKKIILFLLFLNFAFSQEIPSENYFWQYGYKPKNGIDAVIGSQLIVKNNKYSLLKNCRGKEKLIRLKQAIPGFELVAAYSDNEDDAALLKLAENGYWVDKKGLISPFLRE